MSSGRPDVVEPVTATAAAGHTKRADIQGLRAVAVILVVAYHGHLPIPGGFIGVDVFFVISGFVITGMLTRQLQASGRISFAQFYTRRMRRLLPALAVLSTITVMLSLVFLSPLGPQQATARTAGAASLFLSNVQLSVAGDGGYFGLAAETNAMLHTWSLSVEEQFYFVFPTLLVLGWRIARTRALTWILVVVTGLSFAYSWIATYHHAVWLSAFYSPATRIWEFGVGALVASAAPALPRLGRSARILGVVGIALIAVGAVFITSQTPFPGAGALLPVGGAALVLAAGAVTDRGVAALLSARPITHIGDLSYSWYLWHWPAIVFAAAMWPHQEWLLALVAVATLVPAWLSYRFIENPIRRNRRIIGRRAVRLVAACILIPTVASGAALGMSQLERQIPAVATIATAVKLHASETRTDCIGFAVDTCTWPVASPRGTVYLVGDSNGAQFTEPVVAAANAEGYNVVVTARPSCPFVDLIVTGLHIDDGRRCHRFSTELASTLRQRHPALVIVANSSSAYIENSGVAVIDPDTSKPATTPDEKARLWGPAFASVLRELAAPALVIHPVPHFGQWPWDWQPETCSAVRMFTHSCPAGQISRGAVTAQQDRARSTETGAAAQVPAVLTTDLTNDICAENQCTTNRYIPWLYRDATHLSIDGALLLTDHLRNLIRSTVSLGL